jgi:hypothetical protein
LNADRPYSVVHCTPAPDAPSPGGTQSKSATTRPGLSISCVLGFICLAVLIVLWGTSAKLSLYHRHRDASKTTFNARMWIETRSPILTAGYRIRGCNHVSRFPSDLYAIPTSIARAGCEILLAEFAHGPDQLRTSFPHLLRAPPSKS